MTSFITVLSGDKKRIRKRRLQSSLSRMKSYHTVPFFMMMMMIIGSFIINHPVIIVDAAPKTRLTWVNGIGYSMEHMENDAPIISKYFGGKKVYFCHNPTSMKKETDLFGFYNDLTQAGTQKLGRVTEEVNGLVQHLRENIRVVGKNGRVIHIAHSQGALVTYLASKQLSPKEMEKIEVIAFGGAAVLRSTAETPFHRCVNYYSVNDPLLFVVPSAEQALRSGFVVDKELCFLAPRVGDPIEDHHLLGPTYASALAYEGLRFQRHYQTIVYRVFRSIILLLIALFNEIIRKCDALNHAMRQCIVMVLHTFVRSMNRKRRMEVADSPLMISL